MEAQYGAFFNSLDPDTREVIRRMDEHDSLGNAEGGEFSTALAQMLAQIYQKLGPTIERLASGGESAEQHSETLLLILSYAPNSQSYWFIREMIDRHPEVYRFIYNKVATQRPLRMSGKLLRERLLAYMTREQIVNCIYSKTVRHKSLLALEALRRV